MREVECKMQDRAGKIIGGRAIWNIWYADDTTLVSSTKEGIVELTNLINQASNKMGLQINYNKTSSMVVHGEGKIKIQAKELDALRT